MQVCASAPDSLTGKPAIHPGGLSGGRIEAPVTLAPSHARPPCRLAGLSIGACADGGCCCCCHGRISQAAAHTKGWLQSRGAVYGVVKGRLALLLSKFKLLRPVQTEAAAAVMGASCSQAWLPAPQVASCCCPGARLCTADRDCQVGLGALAVLHQRSTGWRSRHCRVLSL